MFSKVGINKNQTVYFEDVNEAHRQEAFGYTTNSAVEIIYALGRLLTKPFLREVSHVTRLFGPHSRPGKAYDGIDYGSVWKWSMRLLHVVEVGVVFIPAAIVAIMGVALKFFCAHFKPKACLLKSDVDFKKYQEGDTPHVKTYNVGLMPSYIRNVNGLRSSMDRAHELVREFNKLAETEQLPDVLCLQECFDLDATRVLLEGLSEHYPHILHSVAPNDAGFSSGLAVVSKYEIQSYSFRCFKNAKAEDKIPNKGLLGVKLKLNDQGDSALVYNTHLQSKYDDPTKKQTVYAEIRQAQLSSIKAWMEEDIDETEHALISLMGDFNVAHVYDGDYAAGSTTGLPSQEYDRAVATLGDDFVDTFYQTHSAKDESRTSGKAQFLDLDCGGESELKEPKGSWYQRTGLDTGTDWGSAWWHSHQEALDKAILDHVFVHKNSQLQQANTEIRHFGAHSAFRSGLSDHLPVSAVFSASLHGDSESSDSESD